MWSFLIIDIAHFEALRERERKRERERGGERERVCVWGGGGVCVGGGGVEGARKYVIIGHRTV